MGQNIRAVLRSACTACFLRRKGLRPARLAADNKTGWGCHGVNAHLVLQAHCFIHVLAVYAKGKSLGTRHREALVHLIMFSGHIPSLPPGSPEEVPNKGLLWVPLVLQGACRSREASLQVRMGLGGRKSS